MAAIILGQVRAHPPGSTSRGVSRDRSGPPPQLCFLSARGRWPSIFVLAPRSERVRGRVEGLESPLEDHLPLSTRPAQVRFPAQATGTATLGEVEAESTARDPERVLGLPAPSPGFTPGPVLAPGPAGCALCGCENPESRIGARSQPTPPRSGRRAGHAQCGRRAAVRQLGSSRSGAVGARTPPAASRRRPPPPDSGKLRGVPGALPDETDTLQIKSNPTAPIPTRIMEAAVAGLPLPPAPAH